MPSPNDNTPAWLQQLDAQNAQAAQQPPAPSKARAMTETPDWLKQLDAENGAQGAFAPAPQSGGTPAWLAQMDVQTAQNRPTPASSQPMDWGPAKNFLTGLARVPGAVIGAPHALLADLPSYLASKAVNALGGNETTASMEARLNKENPLNAANALPTAQGVDNAIFGATGTTPYQPTSEAGRLGQAAVTGLGAGLVDPAADLSGIASAPSMGKALMSFLKAAAPNAARSGAASVAAQGTKDLYPDSDVLPVAAALAAHSGGGLAGSLATGGAGIGADVVRQIVDPDGQGTREAARVLARVPATTPAEALAQPSPAELMQARGNVADATDNIGAGLEPWQAGSSLRDGLQSRMDSLKGTRSQAAGDAYDTFRGEPVLPAQKLAPFMASPSFRGAVKSASDSVLDEGDSPMTEYLDFNSAGDPIFKQNAALPPDVLQRIKYGLDNNVSTTKPGTPAQRTATILRNRFVGFLDNEYPDTYPQTREDYANASRPLDPFNSGPVSKVLDSQTAFGNRTYTMPDERVPDAFLRSPATRTDLNQLIAAAGGDQDSAMGALEQHLAGKAQAAVNPDGTFDADAFNRAMAPYNKSMGNLGFWFPQLAAKFGDAQAAQGTLDTMQTQRALADAVTTGALRNSDGAVTGQSFSRWFGANKDALAQTQSPAAVMRLHAINGALQGSSPGDLADAVKSELIPATIGFASGGLEGGVLGTLLHKTVQGAFSSRDATRQQAFSNAIEKAVLDPDYAAQITATMAKQPAALSPVRSLVRSIANVPLAINSTVQPPS